MEPVPAVRFSALARTVADEARGRGLAVPSFRTPPKRPDSVRTIRWWAGGEALVSVRVRGRGPDEVLTDLVDGVLAANRGRFRSDAAAALRAELLAACGSGGPARPATAA